MTIRVAIHVYSDMSTSKQVEEHVAGNDYAAEVAALREQIAADLSDASKSTVIIGGEVWPKANVHHVRVGVD